MTMVKVDKELKKVCLLGGTAHTIKARTLLLTHDDSMVHDLICRRRLMKCLYISINEERRNQAETLMNTLTSINSSWPDRRDQKLKDAIVEVLQRICRHKMARCFKHPVGYAGMEERFNVD